MKYFRLDEERDKIMQVMIVFEGYNPPHIIGVGESYSEAVQNMVRNNGYNFSNYMHQAEKITVWVKDEKK